MPAVKVAIVAEDEQLRALAGIVLDSGHEPVVIPPECSMDTEIWAEAGAQLAIVSTAGALELLAAHMPAVRRVLLAEGPLAMLPRASWQLADHVISVSVVDNDLPLLLARCEPEGGNDG